MEDEEFWTITGERRLVFLMKREAERKGLERAFCLESLPEASMAIAATSKPSIPITNAQTLSNDESVTTTLTKTADRTEISEVLRQITFANCMAYGMNVMTADQYRTQVEAITKAAIDVISKRAAQPAAAARQ